MEMFGKLNATFFFSLLLFTVINAQTSYNETLEGDLRTLLFTTNDYNKYVRPAQTVDLTIFFGVRNLNKLDMKEQTMECSMFTALMWKDSRLDWSTNELYNSSIDEIFVDETYVWVPKLGLANAVDEIVMISAKDILIMASKDGTLSWTPGRILKTHCECDIRFFPFDTQICDIVLLTWGYSNKQILPQFASVAFVIDFLQVNSEWEYMKYSTSTNVIKSGTYETTELTLYLTFRRRPLYHFMSIVFPLAILSSLLCVVFKLPAESGEKVGYILTVLLTYAVYLTIASGELPTTSIGVSVLATSTIGYLGMSVVAVIITIYVLRCHQNAEIGDEVPSWLLKITEKFLKPCICYKKKGNGCCCCCCCSKQNQNEVDVISDDKKQAFDNDEKSNLTWKDIGEIIDAFCFKLFLYIYILSLPMVLGILLAAYFIGPSI